MSGGRLLLIRHGETVWNAERRFTTRSDVELSQAGIDQARAAARALAGTAIDRVYCSPLVRARKTAELVVAGRRPAPPITVDERLTEIDSGPFEGLTTDEIEAGPLAAPFRAWHTDVDPVYPDGAEPFEAALARAGSFLDEHREEPGTTLVASHGSLVRLIVASYLLGAPPAAHRRLWLDNCRLAVIEQRHNFSRLVALNVAQPP